MRRRRATGRAMDTTAPDRPLPDSGAYHDSSRGLELSLAGRELRLGLDPRPANIALRLTRQWLRNGRHPNS